MGTVTYREGSDHGRLQNVPLSHLSIEVGHFYMNELTDGEDRIRAQFCKLKPLLELARENAPHGRSAPRVSTCFLLDDYFGLDANPKKIITPKEIVEKVDRLSRECGVQIDYMVREAGCRKAGDIHLAELTAGMLAPEPAPGTTGAHPPAQESGWLSNGERSPLPGPTQAMRTPLRPTAEEWVPPEEYGKRNHSIFVDIEMWRDLEKVPSRDGGMDDAPGKWACPFLAAVWHLLRLGMVRYEGRAVLEPAPCPSGKDWPDKWDYVPPIIQLNPGASPFAAYRSTSIMPTKYLQIEYASRFIIDHLLLDEAVTGQVVARAAGEGVEISRSATRRMSHLFIEEEEAPHAGSR